MPMPLPTDSNPKMLTASAPGHVLLSSLTIPAYVDMKPPAKKPYRIANIDSTGNEVEKPQTRKTERAEPQADMKRTFVTFVWSERAERKITPGTDAVYKTVTIAEPVRVDKPIV